MKKAFFLVLISIVLISCKQSFTDKDINKINGYWEIEKVKMANGDDKDYKINQTIDYFEIKDNKGFRKKVMPQFDGTYLTNNLKETIQISNNDGVFFINYITNYGKWKEEIIEIKDSTLVLKNKENIEYHYKRPIPFSVK